MGIEGPRTTLGKALEINRNEKIYGTFAEIGAGQEVARFFFQAGRASQTIAKTISAYDMIYSDEIYGKEANGRYVCEPRLIKMLDKEYSLLIRRLSKTRGDRTTFFAFANTVTTGDQTKRYSHGWMGVRFQKVPNGPHNDIILHVKMLDRYRLQQQETLGVLGVNLVSAAFNATHHQDALIPALVENIREGQVAIDMIRCQGPDLQMMSNEILNLELVRRGLSSGMLFGTDGHLVSLGDTLFKKSLLVQRVELKPKSKMPLDLMELALKHFKKDFPSAEVPLCIFELPMQSFQQQGTAAVNEQEFLDRVQSLRQMGHMVLVSNLKEFSDLKLFLRESTRSPMALVFRAHHLPELFDTAHYSDFRGGLLEGLGKFMDENTHVYIYPHKTKDACTTAESFQPAKPHHLIYQYFREQKWITDLAGCEDITEAELA